MIVVYQMAKVASMAWVESARAAAKLAGTPPAHVHFLNERNLRIIETILAIPPPDNTFINLLPVRSVLRQGIKGNVRISDARKRGQQIRVITGMRDPVARSLSLLSFFADFSGHIGRSLSARDGASADHVCAVLGEFWRLVLAGTVPRGSFEQLLCHMIGAYRTWFCEELNAIFDLDIFSGPFSASSGMQRLHGGGVEVLAYRSEDLAPGAPARRALFDAAQAFLGTPAVALPEVNTAATRRSYPLYTQVRERFRLPLAMLDEIYDAPVVRHFYGVEEIAAFKARWQAHSESSSP